ncbi:MAG: hypothetical protein KGO23_03015 [Nitrospirota bacterium]|nr:hypothetical protein [Nitrospirota bacterium]
MALAQHSVLVSRNLLLPIITGVIAMAESALGCPGVGDWRLPAELESKLQSTAAADDHLSAALIYQKQAQQVEITALKFEDSALKITQAEDPKNFRRSSLKNAGQQCRKEAIEFQRLADDHRQKAETLQENHRAK